MTYTTHSVAFLEHALEAAREQDWGRAGAWLRRAEREIDGAASSSVRRGRTIPLQQFDGPAVSMNRKAG